MASAWPPWVILGSVPRVAADLSLALPARRPLAWRSSPSPRASSRASPSACSPASLWWVALGETLVGRPLLVPAHLRHLRRRAGAERRPATAGQGAQEQSGSGPRRLGGCSTSTAAWVSAPAGYGSWTYVQEP
ncbi:hypothetical protein VPH35_059156 [Triticum aestivum]